MALKLQVPIALSPELNQDQFMSRLWKDIGRFSPDFGFICIQEDDDSAWYYLDKTEGHYTIGLDNFCRIFFQYRDSILREALLTHLPNRLKYLVVYFMSEEVWRKSVTDQMEKSADHALGEQGHVKVIQDKDKKGVVFIISCKEKYDQLNQPGGFFDQASQSGWQRQ